MAIDANALTIVKGLNESAWLLVRSAEAPQSGVMQGSTVSVVSGPDCTDLPPRLPDICGYRLVAGRKPSRFIGKLPFLAVSGNYSRRARPSRAA
tara:strand:- start:119 stop:400 length:282 start_codon:yes stop_codon:yes gene_type:complete